MPEFTLLKARRVLAGPELESVENGAILVADARIVGVGADTRNAAPDGCNVIDLGDVTLMPGMIDAHMHTFGVDSTRLHTLGSEHESYRAARALSELRGLLLAGFTSARCLGSTIGPQVKRAIDEGFADGPSLTVAGAFISSTSGTWDDSGVSLATARSSGELADGPEGLRRAVRERVRLGADFIKLGLSKGGVHDRYHAWGDDPLAQVATYSLEEVKAAVEEAHRNGLKVSAHAIGDVPVRLALEGGVDIIEHGYGISPETRERLVSERKFVVTTLSQVQFHRQAYEQYHYPAWERAVYERHWEFMLRDFKLGLDAGIRFVLGTDMIGAPTHPLRAAAQEFALAVKYGMSTRAALLAGTKLGAEALGTGDVTGTLEPGKLADCIAVDGDPLDDISALTRPAMVMRHGKIS